MKRSPIRRRSEKAARATRSHAETREAVFARDGYRCLLSTRTAEAGRCFGPLTFHHRKKASQGGEYSVENGATLCSSHNDRLESDAELAALGVRLGLVCRRGETLEEGWAKLRAAGLVRA